MLAIGLNEMSAMCIIILIGAMGRSRGCKHITCIIFSAARFYVLLSNLSQSIATDL